MHTPNWLHRLVESNQEPPGGDPPDRTGPPSTPHDPRWDDDHRRVIQALVDERLLVMAGPAVGKTDVACALVAWLILPYARSLLADYHRVA